MNNRPLVSIVIPVYNGSNYLREAIDSALNQTYDNIEIIVVNDGSIDDTEQIALSYGDKIRYLVKENGGSSSALNYGIKQMKGDYFSWLSHDDLYYPNKIEKELSYADNRTVVFSGFDLIDSSGKIIRKTKSLSDVRKYVESHGNEYLIAQPSRYYFSGCTCLIPRDVFDTVGTFDESLRLVNDWDMWFRIYAYGYRIVFVDEALVQSRMHRQQISRYTVFMHDTDEEKAFWNKTLDYLNNHYPDNRELRELFGDCAYRQTMFEIGDKASDNNHTLKNIIKKIRAKTWMFMKKIYLRYWIDTK